MGRQHSGIQDASPKSLQVLDRGSLGLKLGLDGRRRYWRKVGLWSGCSCLKKGGELQPAAGGCWDGAAPCFPLPKVLNSVR